MANQLNYIWLNNLREKELEILLNNHQSLFAKKDLLELGSGTGAQLTTLATICGNVIGIDCIEGEYTTHRVANIVNYDGVNIPINDQSVDVIYSSNVLEHVQKLPELLADCKRVLKPKGYAIHVLPTHTWRIWSIVTHYPTILRKILDRMRKNTDAINDTTQTTYQQRSAGYLVGAMFFPPRHGERGNRFTETSYFHPNWWRSEFSRLGWEVISDKPLGLFYTGNSLFGSLLSIPIRRSLSKFFGSSCHIFITAPKAHQRSEQQSV